MQPIAMSHGPSVVRIPHPTTALEDVRKALDSLPKEIALKRQALAEQYQVLHAILVALPDPQRPDRALALILGEVLCLYGQSLYGDSSVHNAFSSAREFLLASLHLQFYAIGLEGKIVDLRSFSSLPDALVSWQNTPRFFPSMHSFLTTTSHASAFAKARDAQLDAHQLVIFAFALRFTGGTYNNLSKHDPAESPEQKKQRTENILELARALLELQDTPEIQNELRELRYNDLPGYYRSIGREDLYAANWDLLEKEALQNNNRSMLVRIYNKRACNSSSCEEILALLKKTHEQYTLMAKGERNEILYHIFLSNYAHTLMKLTPPQLDTAKQYLDEAYAFVKEQRALVPPQENFNFRFINLNYIRLYMRLGNIEEAKKALQSLENVLKQSPEDVETIAKTKEIANDLESAEKALKKP
jgi:hypothetical protein